MSLHNIPGAPKNIETTGWTLAGSMVEELDLRGERLQYKRLLDLKEWMNSGTSKRNKFFGNGLSGCDPVRC